MVRPMHVPEAPLEQTEHGLVRKGEGGSSSTHATRVGIAGPGSATAPTLRDDVMFQQIGMGLTVLGPGEPMSMYHWEADEEDFLILSGEATLVIEGEERKLGQWDFVRCPPGAAHVIVGGPCVVLGVGSRERHTYLLDDGSRDGHPHLSPYVADPVAQRLGAAPERTTYDSREAYAPFPGREFSAYGGWLE
jgi:mannose-6-phosphate isomerase-like protein (cupin superfamily)